MTQPVYKGDNTGAYGNKFITINLNNPDNYIVSKAIFVCGCIQKAFEDPVFPLEINLTSEETKMLKPSNICYLVTYDSEGRQKTCKGTLTFSATQGVIGDCNSCCN